MVYKDANDVLLDVDMQASSVIETTPQTKQKQASKQPSSTVQAPFEIMKSVRNKLEHKFKASASTMIASSNRPKVKRDTIPTLFK